MGFNKFTIWDFFRILAVMVIIAIIYFGFSDSADWVLSQWSKTQPPADQGTEQTATTVPTTQPTDTPAITITPTATPLPSPTPVLDSLLMDGQKLIFWNEFDDTDPVRGDWYLFPNVEIKDGYLVIESSKNWDGVYGDLHLVDHQAALVKFRFYGEADFYITFETGEWLTDSYRAWGIGSEDGMFAPVISNGTLEYTGEFAGNPYLQPDHWYVVMLYIGGMDQYRIKVWDYNDKSLLLEYVAQMDETWVDLVWSSTMIVGSGQLQIDRYEEINAPFN